MVTSGRLITNSLGKKDRSNRAIIFLTGYVHVAFDSKFDSDTIRFIVITRVPASVIFGSKGRVTIVVRRRFTVLSRQRRACVSKFFTLIIVIVRSRNPIRDRNVLSFYRNLTV